MTPAARTRRFLRIYDIGCLACQRRGWHNECQIQHLNLGGHAGQPRRGDQYTIGLCPWHHQGQPIRGMTQAQSEKILGPSLAHNSKAFREAFGSDEKLLARQNELIAEWESCVVGRTA